MIPISEIKRIIHDYEIRRVAISKIMVDTKDAEQAFRCAGKREAYVGIIIDLKELIPK
jgi:hypothetical protein